MASEARHYFGLSPDPSVEEIRRVADRYPVFRVIEDRRPSATAAAARPAEQDR